LVFIVTIITVTWVTIIINKNLSVAFGWTRSVARTRRKGYPRYLIPNETSGSEATSFVPDEVDASVSLACGLHAGAHG
jgi:hypothetical protein